jgi:hypothetical protein
VATDVCVDLTNCAGQGHTSIKARVSSCLTLPSSDYAAAYEEVIGEEQD